MVKTLCIILGTLLLVWIAYSWFSTRNLEKPTYTTIEQRDGFEIRQYDPYIIAEAPVPEGYSQGLNSGFRVIADYIFGNNTAADKIAMTAPVTDTIVSEKIAMTAPVLDTVDSGRKIAFVMPSQYTMETLPKPNNPAVTIKEVPGFVAAVKRFSWYPTNARVQAKEAQLQQSLANTGLEIAGPISRAFYNAPGTFPLLLRSEIIVPIVK